MTVSARLARRLVRFLTIVLMSVSGAGSLLAQESSDCLMCHGEPDFFVERDGVQVSMTFDEERFAQSVHASVECIDCHVDLDGVESFPHEARLEPARCDNCHDDSFESIAAYLNGTHGQQVAAGNEVAPRCHDCHGGHDILKRTNPQSKAYVLNIPRMCTQCHGDAEPVARVGELTRDQIVDRYKDTIHGPGLFEQGLKVAPVCINCHSAHGVLPHTDPASLIHKDRVNDSCAQCHNDEEQVHRGVVAEEAWSQPGLVPICVDCHQPHGERRVAYGTNMSDVECLECHGDPAIATDQGRASLLVDAGEMSRSIHGRKLIACAQCHTGITPSEGHRPCETTKVDCSICHDAQVDAFHRGIHGSLHLSGDPDAPDCVECHGRHDIMESDVPEGAPEWLHDAVLASPTHRRNVPELCSRCHKEGAAATIRSEGGDDQKVEHYRESIHGKGLLESGLIASANCVDCHSAHMELPPSDPASTVAPENIVATCGKCHDGIGETFRDSIHSPHGNPEFEPTPGRPGLPHCNDCHTSHSVARTDLAAFKRSIVQQCGNCHEHITETYFDTHHGKLTALGDTVAARCEDCHGAHDIRPASDPTSMLHESNVVATCGNCHEGSHREFAAGYLTHANHHDRERYPALFWSFTAMTWLLVGVFGFFGLHVVAWFPRSLALRREMKRAREAAGGEVVHAPEGKVYRRFNRLNRNLHRMVIVSFLALALTGLALKFSDTAWAKTIMSLLGGTATAGWIHRFGAVITFAYFAIHLFDLVRRFRKSGESLYQYFLGPNTMIPTWRDVTDFAATMRWFLGLGPRPRYGKWTYWEKFDYFAVFWGVFVIGLSGLVLWFPVQATWILPGWAINVATIIHSEEALLATGFIFSIHFFNTHLRPEKFPMDKVVFTGSMPIEELKTDKPELYERLVATGELDEHLVEPPSAYAKRRAYVFGFLALGIGVALLVLLLHGLLTVGL